MKNQLGQCSSYGAAVLVVSTKSSNLKYRRTKNKERFTRFSSYFFFFKNPAVVTSVATSQLSDSITRITHKSHMSAMKTYFFMKRVVNPFYSKVSSCKSSFTRKYTGLLTEQLDL